MTQNRLPGDILNDVAARIAAAELVRLEILRLEKVILQMEHSALYYANTEFGPESGAKMIDLCKTMLQTPSVQALAAPLYASSVGRGIDVGIAGSPGARQVNPVSGYDPVAFNQPPISTPAAPIVEDLESF